MTPFEKKVMISTDKALSNIDIAGNKLEFAENLLHGGNNAESILAAIDFLLDSMINVSLAVASLRDIVEDEEFKDE